MEVRPAYKQTEVGVIPEEWEVKRLGDVVDTDPEALSSDTRPEFTFRYIALEDVDRGVLRGHSDHRFATAPSRARRKLRLDDVLVSTVRPNLQSHLLFRGEGSHWVCSTGFCVLRCRPNITHPGYVFYHLFAHPVSRQIEALITGSNYPAINRGDVRALELPFPHYGEQAAIAVALSDVDALLGGLDRLIAKKRDLKQAAMQQLLTGQTRLSGFSEEWEVKRLGEIAHIKTGSRNNEDKIEDGEYPFFVRSENVERINSYSHDCEAILVPGEGRIGDIFHYINGRFDVHQRVYAITQFTPGTSAKFVHLYMAMAFGVWAMQNTVKATVDSLRLPTFQTFEMRLPPSENEQTAIAVVLSDMGAELAALEARRDKTRDLKQAMMQELLTGKTRLAPEGAAHA